MKTDPLSSSCFSEIRLVKGEMDDDDELTSLAWLQDTNLIKNINAGEVDEQFTDDDGQKENGDIRTVVPTSAPPHPPHVPYNPQKHINSKPPYSFSCLIFMAIEESPQKSLPVKDIYSWILKNFPYFLNAPTGWKNSVRHNLSLNKCFKKVEKDKGQVSVYIYFLYIYNVLEHIFILSNSILKTKLHFLRTCGEESSYWSILTKC